MIMPPSKISLIGGRDRTFLTGLNAPADQQQVSLHATQSQMSIQQNEEPRGLYQSRPLSMSVNKATTDQAVRDNNTVSAMSSEAEETLDELRVNVNQTISKHASLQARRKEVKARLDSQT